MGLAFVDLETVTLTPGPDVIWEIGIITRDDGKPDEEWRFQVRPNMDRADPESLRISRYAKRYELGPRQLAAGWLPPDGAMRPLVLSELAWWLDRLLAGRHVFGLCPSFDTLRLSLLLRKLVGPSHRDPWHYQPHDIEDQVVGYLLALREQDPGSKAAAVSLTLPYDTDALVEAVGLPPMPEEDQHTALGDARRVRDFHDAIRAGGES